MVLYDEQVIEFWTVSDSVVCNLARHILNKNNVPYKEINVELECRDFCSHGLHPLMRVPPERSRGVGVYVGIDEIGKFAREYFIKKAIVEEDRRFVEDVRIRVK